jgi:circadian clock protein KaiC
MEKIKTGVSGLDALVGGGFPRGFNILIAGKPGCGKTILGLQYLYNGAKEGEVGLYVSLDARIEEIKEQGRMFGWDIDDLCKQKKLVFLEIPLNRIARVNLFKLIEDTVKNCGATRLVFDSLSSFIFNINQFILDMPYIDDLSKLSDESKEYLGEDLLHKKSMPEDIIAKERPDPEFYRDGIKKRVVYLMLRELAYIGTTNIVINSQRFGDDNATMDGVSEFVCDGIVQMETIDLGGGPARMLKVVKMRNSNNSLELHNFDITANGIAIT